ncbi:MAG: MG2 domain-containing protein, partial [Dokdonella sp.]
MSTFVSVRLWRHVFCALLIAAILSLPACNRQPSGVPEVQKMPVVVEAEKSAKPEGFALTESRSEMYQGQLALTLEFSDRIAGAQTFDELLSVTGPKGEPVTGSWALDDDGLTLRFPYVQANTHYTLRMKKSLAAADGKTLGADMEKAVFTGPMEPAVGFASQGNVLPARESRGLPVVGVNVKEVDVEFLRVNDNEVANFFAAYQRNAQRSSWDLDPSYGWYGRGGKPVAKIAESVYANRFVLDGKENERTLSYLPIQNITELQQPGLYFAVMKRAGSFGEQFETAFFFVSDIGLHTRAYKDQLFVHAASLKSGEALEGVEINIVDARGTSVVTASTDESGNALIGWKLDSAYVLTARTGKDVSLLPFNQPALDLSDFAVSGRKQQWFDVFAWSGRDLYRPGETVRLSAVLRDFDGAAIKPQPLFVTLKQPDGRVYAQAKLDPKELNYFDYSKTIPEDAPTGRWQVEFRLDPAAKEATQGMTFRIEEFLPERLKLDLATTQEALKPDEALQLNVQGDYLYGAPAAGNRFTARLTVAVDQHPLDAKKDFYFGDPTITLSKEAKDVVDEKLDDKGHLTQAISVVEEKPATPVAAIVSGSVYETGGRTVTRTLKRTLWPANALVGIRPLFDPKEGANSNAQAGFEIIRADSSGELVASQPLKVTLVRERRDYNWIHDNENGWHFNYIERYEDSATSDVTLAADKAGAFSAPVEWGNYRLDVLDPETGLTTRFPFYAGWSWNDDNRGGEARPDKVKLALDKPSYRAGDTLKVTITAPQQGPGLILVESDHLIYTQVIDARKNATIEIPVTEDWERHDVYLTALVFRGGSAVEKVTPARAVGEVFIPINREERKVEVTLTAPKLMKPEQDLDATVKASALAGKMAFVTVSAV